MSLESQNEIIRKAEAFVTIDEVDYFVDDWLTRSTSTSTDRPLVIVSAFEDEGKRSIVIRDEKFRYETMSLSDFIKAIESGELIKIPKPLYHVSDCFKNKFTEKSITIIEVPFKQNDENNQYVYFVLEYSTTYGQNFKSMTEQEITDFYEKEGVVK